MIPPIFLDTSVLLEATVKRETSGELRPSIETSLRYSRPISVRCVQTGDNNWFYISLPYHYIISYLYTRPESYSITGPLRPSIADETPCRVISSAGPGARIPLTRGPWQVPGPVKGGTPRPRSSRVRVRTRDFAAGRARCSGLGVLAG